MSSAKAELPPSWGPWDSSARSGMSAELPQPRAPWTCSSDLWNVLDRELLEDRGSGACHTSHGASHLLRE